MKIYKVHETKTNLSRILLEVAEGKTVYIARGNEVVAELKPVNKPNKPFPFGIWKDKFELNENWRGKKVKKDIEDQFYDTRDLEML